MRRLAITPLLPAITILFLAQQGLGLGNAARQTGATQPKTAIFRIDRDLILDIASQHPRFAATLANRNQEGFSLGKARAQWMPIEMTAADVSALLGGPGHEGFLEDFNNRARAAGSQVEAGKASSIVYDINVSKGSDDQVVLELKVVKGWDKDPPFTLLVLTISGVNPGEGFRATRDNTEWRLEPGTPNHAKD
jgi:hypothetical protein